MCRLHPLIHECSEVTRRLEEVAPFGVVTCAGFGCDYLGQGLTLFFESGDFIADVSQHIAEEDEVGFAAHSTVAGNDDRLVSRFCDVRFGRAYLPVDAPP